MNATRGFSARLNGFRHGHPAKRSSRQKNRYVRDVENVNAGPKAPYELVGNKLVLGAALLRSVRAEPIDGQNLVESNRDRGPDSSAANSEASGLGD